jgi:hypothetical protein
MKERPFEFMYILRAQIRYTVWHLFHYLAMAEGGWHAHGSRYPRTYRLFFYSFDCHEPSHVHLILEHLGRLGGMA